MLDFTGERVIPGVVESDLFNEHLARYRFAARFAVESTKTARVLDSGCGAGYGTTELANTASVVGLDISAEAVRWAREKFSRPGVHFVQGGSESLPFADSSFDLVVAFEVIEHLDRWEQMLTESRRVLGPSGILLVSTPNKSAYNESRADAGPNPWHVHEFEYEEFQTALNAVFPHVHIWTQNHSEAIVFAPASSCRGVLDSAPDRTPEQALFYLAACSQSPIPDTRSFAWIPSSGNVLRERERHIALLESELRQKDAWLDDSRNSLETLHKLHESVLTELQERNEWASRLNTELDTGRAHILRMERELESVHAGYRAELESVHAGYRAGLEAAHNELESVHKGYRAEITRMEAEDVTRLAWIRDLESQIEGGRAEIARLQAHLENLEQATVVRIGRKLNLLPEESE